MQLPREPGKMTYLPTVFLTLLGATSAAGQCLHGYVHHDQSCYALVRVKASWAEAAVYCQAVGGHLAFVESATEHQFVKALLQNESTTIITDGVWLGGLDYLVEGEWQWGFHRRRIDLTWWNTGDPNNEEMNTQFHNGDHNTHQNCLMIWKENSLFLWDDEYCSEQQYFLCEAEVDGIVIG